MLARLKVFVDSGNGSKQLSNQLHFLLKIKFLEAIIHSSFIKVENRTRLEQKCCPQQELVSNFFFCFQFRKKFQKLCSKFFYCLLRNVAGAAN